MAGMNRKFQLHDVESEIVASEIGADRRRKIVKLHISDINY